MYFILNWCQALKLRIESQGGDDLINVKNEDSTADKLPSDDNENFQIVSVIPYIVTSHIIGVALFLSPVPFDLVGQKAALNTQDAIFYGILSIFVVVLFLLPNVIHRFVK